MPVVSFTDLAAPARYDEQPWTEIRVEQAANAAGPWTEVDTVTLDPLDTNPSSPRNRSVTTVDGTLDSGYYRVVWVDADDNELARDAIQWPLVADIRPTVDDIAALLHARTNVMGVEIGTFNDDTRPTEDQVETLIDTAVADLQSRIGEFIPAAHQTEARRLAALQTATLVEASFFPNSIDSDRSAYRQYGAMYLNGVQALGMIGRAASGTTRFVYAT